MSAIDMLDSLIERAKRADATAFDELVEVFAPRLYGFLYRLTGRPEDADDLVQEVFLRVVQRIGDYQHDGRFEAWIFRIATNLARDRIRRMRRTLAPLSGDLPSDESSGGGTTWDHLADISAAPPDAPLELSDDVDRLQRALARLPAAEREVIMLRHFSDMTFAEIARAMGTPLGTALARSHRALTKLREYMEPDR